MDEEERGCWVAFERVPGIGAVRVRRLLDGFGTLRVAWRAAPAELARAGLDRRSLDALLTLRARLDPGRELERARRGGARVLTWQDGDYPRLLAAIPDPPPVLFVRGDLGPLGGRALAVVGTRRPTYYGRDIAERLAGALAGAGLAVISGLAKGIDTHAHRGALAAGGRTIAVLGHGLHTIYPPENRRLAEQIVERGALVTEHPPGVGPEAQHFPPRNRIISGLAAGVLVVEAGEQSGALITSRYAGEQGRDVFAVPGQITSAASAGCHRLIQDGAKLVAGADDVLRELQELGPYGDASGGRDGGRAQQMAFDLEPAAGPHPAARILAALAESAGPAHVDVLARRLAVPVQAVSGALALLEVEGRVRHVGGLRYALTPLPPRPSGLPRTPEAGG